MYDAAWEGFVVECKECLDTQSALLCQADDMRTSRQLALACHFHGKLRSLQQPTA
jgi:hypothetical protein